MKKNIILAAILATMATSAMAADKQYFAVAHDLNNLGSGGALRYGHEVLNSKELSQLVGTNSFIALEVEVKRVETTDYSGVFPNTKPVQLSDAQKFEPTYGNKFSAGPALHVQLHQFPSGWGVGGVVRVGVEAGKSASAVPNLSAGITVAAPRDGLVFDMRIDKAQNRPDAVLLGVGMQF